MDEIPLDYKASDIDEPSKRPSGKMNNNAPFLFEHIRAVDETALAQLFDQLRVETNGKLVHPQWKHFRHMKMIRNDRTRLSNAIWRSWFIQMKLGKKPLFCQFNVDISLEEHKVPQAVPIEGKYWKRRSEAVAMEYKRWRLFYKQKRSFNQRKLFQSSGEFSQAESENMDATQTANVMGNVPNSFYILEDIQDVPDNLLSTQLPFLLSSHMMDTGGHYQPRLDTLNPDPFIDELMDHSWLDFESNKNTVGDAAQLLKQSQQYVPTTMTDFTQPYAAGLILTNQFDQQNKNRDDMAGTSASSVGHGNDTVVKAEVSSNSSSNDVKELQYIPRGNSNLTLSSEMASASPISVMHHSHSLPTMGHHGDSGSMPVFQGLLDPKAQYHKTLAEHSRMEKAQRKLQEEAHKQQQFYMQLLQQKSNELPETTRHQAEMLQLILSDPNMMHLLQNVFKGQQQDHPVQDHPTSPPQVSPKQPQMPAMPLSSVPPVMSPAPPPISPSLQNTFQYQSSHSNSSSKELSQLAATSSEVQFSENKPMKPLTPEERKYYKEVRRQSHITAEQKRRGNIKAGLDQLQSLISRVDPLSQSQSKMSKANVLMKSVDYIQRMHSRRETVDSDIANLQAQVEHLNSSINRLQEQLPASGASSGVSGRQYQENQRRFTQYVCERSTQNYQFWIFSLIVKKLFESYNSMVSTSSMDEFYRTAMAWNSQQCSLAALRPVVQDGLRQVSQTTSILTQPNKLPQELIELIQEQTDKLRENRLDNS